jgi:hypothetical protein
MIWCSAQCCRRTKCSPMRRPCRCSIQAEARPRPGGSGLPIGCQPSKCRFGRCCSDARPDLLQQHSAVLAMSRTRRAGARRRCRFAASWTTPARGALPEAGRDGGMSYSAEQRDGCWFTASLSTVLRIEYCLPLEQDASEPKQPIGDTTDGAAIRVAAFTQFAVTPSDVGIVLDSRPRPVKHRIA